MSKGSYETFTSASSPTIPDKGNYATEDSGEPKNTVSHGDVPTVPQSK